MAEYYFLVSSLPTLEKYAEPFWSTDEFIESCEDVLTPRDLSMVKSLKLTPFQSDSHDDSALSKWNEWEICLRNKIAKARAPKLDREAEGDLLPEADSFPEVDKAAQDIASASNPLEAERILDDLRWNRADDLEACHGFDVDKLCAYKIKLMLCEKWSERKETVGVEKFNQVIDSVYSD